MSVAPVEHNYAAIRDDSNPDAWLWSEYDKASKVYNVIARGVGASEMLESRDSSKILFGVVRTSGDAPKFVRVLSIGESASPIAKGKAMILKGPPFEAFQGAVATEIFLKRDDCDFAEFLTMLRDAVPGAEVVE